MLCDADCNRCNVGLECPLPQIRVRTINVIGIVFDKENDVNIKGIIASISVATYPLDPDKSLFRMACAFRSPKDRFDRQEGHMISTRRLLTAKDGRKSFTIIQKKEDEKLIETIKKGCIDISRKMGIKWMEEIGIEDLK